MVKNMKKFGILSSDGKLNSKLDTKQKEAVEKLIKNGATYCYTHNQNVPTGSSKSFTNACELTGGCENAWNGSGGHYCTSCNSDRKRGQCSQCNLRNNLKHFGIHSGVMASESGSAGSFSRPLTNKDLVFESDNIVRNPNCNRFR